MADRRCCSSFCGWRSICSFASRELVECKLLFRLRGSVIPRAALFALPSAALSVLMHYRLGTLSSVPANAGNVNAVWSSVTFVLGVLLVFRTNQAYARYWEGATLLMQVRGEWLNASSSLVAFCSVVPEMTAEVAKFQHQLVRLMSLLYCGALQQVSFVKDDSMEVIDMAGLDESSLFFLVESEERCDVILQWIRRLIVLNMSSGVIPVPPPILTRVFQELSRGLVAAKDVQKIAEFPFPFPYTQLLLAMLVAETVLTPVMAANTIEHPAWAGVVSFCAVLALWSINYIAGELEQPFGDGVNDLPITDMMRDMNVRLRALLDIRVRTPPEFYGSLDMMDPQTTSCAACGYTSTKKAVEGFTKVCSVASSSNREPMDFAWMTGESSVCSYALPSVSPGTRSTWHSAQSATADAKKTAFRAQFSTAPPTPCETPDATLQTKEGPTSRRHYASDGGSPGRAKNLMMELPRLAEDQSPDADDHDPVLPPAGDGEPSRTLRAVPARTLGRGLGNRHGSQPIGVLAYIAAKSRDGGTSPGSPSSPRAHGRPIAPMHTTVSASSSPGGLNVGRLPPPRRNLGGGAMSAEVAV